MELTSLPILLLFGVTTLLTLFLFLKASRFSLYIFVFLAAYLLVQGIISWFGFYLDFKSMPPHFVLLVAPPMLIIVFLFATKIGRSWLDRLQVRDLNLLHIVRIPVELVLFALYLDHAVPELMTFEGRNFDILSGITAPLVVYFGYVKAKLGKGVLITWNIICLGLLINIVTHAVLSAPLPFQQMAFEQPNIAVFYFPFVFLPGFIVPLVLLAHLVSLRNLLRKNEPISE